MLTGEEKKGEGNNPGKDEEQRNTKFRPQKYACQPGAAKISLLRNGLDNDSIIIGCVKGNECL